MPSCSLDHFSGLGHTLCSGLWPGSRLHPGLHGRHTRRRLPCLHHVRDDGARSCTHLQRRFAPESGVLFSGEHNAVQHIVCAHLHKNTGTQPASPTVGPTGLHLYPLSTHPALPEEERTAKEEHWSHTDSSRRKTRYPVPSEWKATFKWKESSETHGWDMENYKTLFMSWGCGMVNLQSAFILWIMKV